MTDAGRRFLLTPAHAWWIPTAFLCLLVPARTGVAVDAGTGAAGAGMAIALFALPLLYTVPRGRAVWNRCPRALLTVQAVLTYLPFVMFGQRWIVGLSGLLAGLLLLTVRAPLSWLWFLAVVALEGVLRIGVFGVYPAAEAQFYSWVFVVPIDMALPLFGLVRLADLVADLRTARTDLARLAVTRERLATAARLGAAVGGRLEAVIARSTAALGALATSHDRARAELTAAAGLARRAVEQVRQAIAEDGLDPGGPARGTGRTVAPRLAVLILVLDLGAFSLHHGMIVASIVTDAPTRIVAVAAILAIAVLQLHHSLGWRDGARPRGWYLTFPAQAALPFADYTNLSLLGLPGFPAGSALLLLKGRWAWAAFAVIASSMGVYWGLAMEWDADGIVYLIGLAASTGLAVYGLSRLTQLAEELETTRRQLARAAVERERLRVARDTHDLLGLGLSAVALKCDLAGRLIGRDEGRAREELFALLRLAAAARADLTSVTTGEHELSLRRELATARELLASAGVTAQVSRGAPALPRDVDAVLATVLREAVTNVLRHARPTRCVIELTTGDDAVTLRVINDGVTEEPDLTPGRTPRRDVGGHGLANLDARVAALGGRLRVTAGGDRFELTARLPSAAGESQRPDVENPLPAGDPAHGVDEVVGRPFLDEEA